MIYNSFNFSEKKFFSIVFVPEKKIHTEKMLEHMTERGARVAFNKQSSTRYVT